MKRWLLRILAFLVLGAIVNVAVAWGCAAFSEIDFDTSAVVSPDAFASVWNKYSRPNFEDRPLSAERLTGFEWELDVMGRGPHDLLDARIGWPKIGMRWLRSRDAYMEPASRVVRHHACVVVWRGREVELPLLPIWPGFAINTVFYAVGGWLLFAGPFALRRRWRIKRGLCARCAYNLRGSTGGACPECGATK